MNNIKIAFLIFLVFVGVSSCLKTETPTPQATLMGEWLVDNVIVDGQVDNQQVFAEDAVLHLENNNTYLFVNVDGLASSGEWSATDSVLTLNGNDNYVQVFNVTYVDWEKLNMYRTFSIATGNQIEVRYLFRKIEN